MKIKILCVGKIKEKYFTDAIEEYTKRLGRFCKVEIVEVSECTAYKTDLSASEIDKIKKTEGKDLLSKIEGFGICLDIGGKQLASEELASKIDEIKNTNSVGAFLTKMYEGYVNRYNLDIVQTNDLCTTIYMLYPEIFKTYKCNIEVDTNLMPGKTIITEDENGLVTFVEDTNRELFVEKFMHHLKNINQ